MFMLNSKEVIWDGPSIPCLQLCKGDTVTDVVYNIAKKVCEITSDLDVQNLDYSCIIDKSIKYGNVDLFLFFTMLLKNDCKIKDLLDAKIDANDTTELLVDNLDLKCFLQPYLDNICAIIRFYNQPGFEINPNDNNAVFQRAELKNPDFYYVSDIDQSVWIWNGIQYVKDSTNLNKVCVCELKDIELDVKSTLQVIIDNLCQTKVNGVIKACDTFKVVPFDTIDPNTVTTIFTGIIKEQSSYYISNITHKLWRWVDAENSYLPSILTTANINLASIDSCLLQAEVFLQDWLDQYKVYQEPSIISCLSSTPTIFSNHVTDITDSSICELQNNIGTAKNVYYALLGCNKINIFTGAPNSPLMLFNDPIYNNPDYFYVNYSYDYPFVWNGSQYAPYKRNLAEQELVQWEKVCDLLDRVKNIESTCCTPSCDGITIKFSPIYNSEDGTFSLVFDSASGTVIPEDFTDCGSILTATDKNGTKVSLDIELAQDVIIDLDTSSLDLSSTVNVNIKSCLSNGSLTCKTCYSQSLPIIEKCGICKICAVDSSENGGENVIVYYTLASSPNVVQNTKLLGGQCLTFKLPEDLPTIKSIITSSANISLENDPTYPCNDVGIPAAVANTCWFFEVPMPLYNSDVLMDKFENNGAIGSCISKIDFDLSINDTRMETYQKYFDYNNPNGATISGNIAQVSVLSTDNMFSSSADSLMTLLNLPTYTTSNILSITSCTGTLQNHITITKTGTGSGVSLVGPNDSIIDSISPAGIGGGNLLFNNTLDVLSTNRHGFVLKVQGQPTNINGIQKPEISLRNPINGAITYIKGELLSDECECPS